MMNQKEKNAEISRWETIIKDMAKAYRELDAACDAAIKAGCMDINGALHEAIWRAFETAMQAIDRDCWLSWFIQENDCGRKQLEASLYGDPKPIRTARELAKLIVETNQQQKSK